MPPGSAVRATAGSTGGTGTAGGEPGGSRLPRRQGRDRTASCPCPRRQRDGLAELGNGRVGGLARQVGHEPDAHQRFDTPIWPRRPPAGR